MIRGWSSFLPPRPSHPLLRCGDADRDLQGPDAGGLDDQEGQTGGETGHEDEDDAYGLAGRHEESLRGKGTMVTPGMGLVGRSAITPSILLCLV